MGRLLARAERAFGCGHGLERLRPRQVRRTLGSDDHPATEHRIAAQLGGFRAVGAHGRRTPWRRWAAYYTVPARRARAATRVARKGVVVGYANLAQMFFARADELADRPRYRYRDDQGWHDVTWAASRDRVRAIAAGLIDDGVQPGERVALL